MDNKNYSVPVFEVVRQDDSNTVFFTASGAAPSFSGSIASMTSTDGSW